MSDAAAIAYTACWSVLCVAAIVVSVRRRHEVALAHGAYWRFLLRPWKLATFAVAATGLVWMAPYSGDPTWDYADAALMAILTFAFAPWSIGALWRVGRRRLPRFQAFIALCAWLLSASWSYDGYQFARTGFYPPAWASNLVASSVLFVTAGMLWSLEHRPGRGVTFGFIESDWPTASAAGSDRRIALYAFLIMLLVAIGFWPFLRSTLASLRSAP